MYKLLFFCLISSLAFATTSNTQNVKQVSEAMGHIIGKNLDTLGLDLDIEAIVKGLKEESEGKSSPMNEDECIEAIAHLQEEKMTETADKSLKTEDQLSNGDQIQEDENHPFPASNPPKHR